MRHLRHGLILILLLLFTGLTFNAYACLVPLFGTSASSWSINGCVLPHEQPVHQFCDGFKVLSVQSGGELDTGLDSQFISSEDTASLSLLLRAASTTSRLCAYLAEAPPQDLLLKIAVLRI